MKHIISILLMALLLGLSSRQAISQDRIHFVDMDIALEHYQQDSVTSTPCGYNKVFISFDIRNKLLHIAAQCAVKFDVSNINADAGFNINSPTTCTPGIKCFKLDADQKTRVHAQAKVLNSWLTPYSVR